MKKLRASSLALCLKLSLTLTLTLGLNFISAPAMAQVASPIIGDWEGTLNPGAQPKKRIVVHISAAQDGSLTGTIDYPDQDTSGIQMTAITYRGSILHFESTPSLTVYDGTMDKDNSRVVGTVKQGGAILNLTLHRTP